MTFSQMTFSRTALCSVYLETHGVGAVLDDLELAGVDVDVTVPALDTTVGKSVVGIIKTCFSPSLTKRPE
jgi:hypothetical protein